MPEDQRARGVIAASAGNHSQGLSYHGTRLGVPVTIVMPRTTPTVKVMQTESVGGKVELFGETFDEAYAHARELEQARGLTFVHPFDDPDVAAGQGTVALEMLAAQPDLDCLVVPIGGGGLISGVATALKAANPAIEVIGVNARSAPSMYNFIYGTEYPEVWDTLAEALSGSIEDGSITLDIVRDRVDRMVLVEEAAIAAAIRWMLDEQGWLVEGGGAVGVAALLSGAVVLDNRPTVVIVSGGNIDGTTLRRVLGDASGA